MIERTPMHRRALLVMPSLALAGAARAQSAGVALRRRVI